MTPGATNAQSYELTEGRITRANTERESDRASGGSFEDWMLGHDIPELFSMDTVYREIARKLNKPNGVARNNDTNEPLADFWPEGESVEDFIAAATEGRYEEEDEPDF